MQRLDSLPIRELHPFSGRISAADACSRVFAELVGVCRRSAGRERLVLEERLTGARRTALYSELRHVPRGRGEGMEDVFPPLDGSQVVNGVDAWSVMLVMHGRGVMPGFNHILDDEEMAAVLSYTRTSWNSRAGPISPELVRRMRVEAFEPLH